MKEQLTRAQAECREAHDQVTSLLATQNPSEEQLNSLESALNRRDDLIKTIQRLTSILSRAEDKDVRSFFTEPITSAPTADDVKKTLSADPNEAFAAAPLKYQRGRVRLKSFKNPQEAYDAGKWILGAITADPEARKYCTAKGLNFVKAQTETSNVGGGFLVPTPLETTLIELMETYGAARRALDIYPMSSDTAAIPRRTGGLTAYFVGENATITESTAAWDRVNLAAKKTAVLAKWSSEVGEDAIVSMTDKLAFEASYAQVKLEDQCAFIGDGTSTYGSLIGILQRFKNQVTDLAGTWPTNYAYHPGVQIASGNAFTEVTLRDINSMKARLAGYAYTPNTAYFCNTGFYYAVMEALAVAAGGVVPTDIVNGMPTPRFLGHPVIFAQVLPEVEANSAVPLYFGDFSLAGTFGDRRAVTIATSEHLNFAEDELAIRMTTRWDVNIHDTGTAHATTASQVRGPAALLLLAAS